MAPSPGESSTAAVNEGSKPDGWAWWPVLLGVVCVYWPLLLGKIVFHRDAALWMVSARMLVRQSLLTWQWPAWNPYQGLGIPVSADPQYALFYPPHWLYLMVPDGLVAHLATWLGLAHLMWGGVGMALLARRLGADPLGAAVAGLAWALSGPITSAWSIGTLVLGMAWIPWIARGLHIELRGHGPFPLVSAVWPATLSLLAGEPFMTAMGLVFACWIALADPPPGGIRALARAGVAWLWALLIAAVSWFPSLYALKGTERARSFDRVTAELYSHHPLRMLEMLMPGALGDPTGPYPAGQWVGEPDAGGAPLFFSSYLGIVTVVFGLCALRRRRVELILAGAAVLALLLSFGKHTPVHEIWRRIFCLPFAHMHSPEKYGALLVASSSLLAGLGVTRVLAEGRFRRARVAGLALLLVALAAVPVVSAPWLATMRPAALRALLLLAALLALIAVARKSPRLASLALLGLLVFDLGRPVSRLAGFGPAHLLHQVPPAAKAILADSAADLTPPRLFRGPDLEQAAGALGAQATWLDSQERAVHLLTPNLPNLFGIGVVPGYSAAIPPALARLGPRTFADLARALRMLSVRYALLTDPTVLLLAQDAPVTVLSRPLPGISLVSVGNNLPRVFLAGTVREVGRLDTQISFSDERLTTGQEALVPAHEDVGPALGAAGDPIPCELVSYAAARIVARCRSPRAALAVFVEQFSEGWTAQVDGRAAPVVRTNGLLRGVPLGPGDHQIELRYRTPGLRLAIFSSLLALLALLLKVGLRFPTGYSPLGSGFTRTTTGVSDTVRSPKP